MDSLVEIYHEKRYISASAADKAKRQFAELLQREQFFASCKAFKWNDRVVLFYVDNANDYPELLNVIKLTLLISPGNARVEARFSVNKSTKKV